MHPPKDQLIAFGQGKLTPDDSVTVERHLETCPTCCETLLDLKDDTFTGLVRIAKLAGSAEIDRNLRQTSVTEAGVAAGEVHDETHGFQATAATVAGELPVELREHPRYRIVSLVGRGGMGDVYRAEHRLMNRPVALKLINAQLVRNPQAVERFRREVRAAAKLTHPNIVAAYDAEQAGDAHFLVMEFVSGTDLATLVSQRGPMSIAEACGCIRQAVEGLAHAHDKGMVHRDIKPHNLMLSADGHVRILDFGLAGFASESAADVVKPNAAPDRDCQGQLTTIGSVMGTPDYIAPEQARDAHSADIRADIYSLGCTLWFLLTGKPPFEADNVFTKIMAHAEQAVPSLLASRPDAPAELSRVLAKMMAKDPAERFQSPAEVVAALDKFTQAAVPLRKRVGRLVAVALFFLALALAAVVIHVQTDKGEFVIEANDDVAVLIENSGVRIHDKASGQEYSLKPGRHPVRSGEYLIDVAELPSGLELSTDQFRLTRGGESKVVVRFKPTEPTPLDPAALGAVERKVLQAAEPFLVLLDEGKFDQVYDASSALAKRAATREQVMKQFRIMQETLGKGKQRTLHRVWVIEELPGQPNASFACVEYKARFEKREGPLYETVLLNLEDDGKWRMNTYAGTFEPLPLPGPKPGRPASEEAKSSKPALPLGPNLPAGVNLLTDSSFEATPIGGLPMGWSTWFNDGPASRAEVVDGGRTDKHCLQIMAKGTRAVVFANSIPMDRSKRFALKGWTKFDGPKSSRAIIKLNYFHNGKFLGVHDLMGATGAEWQLLEKTDLAESYPDASLLVATCHVEGDGTAWFDDLELRAYDRGSVPPNFDAVHGRNNRPPADADFNLWVGRWTTTGEFGPTANSPGRTISGTTQSQKVLGDRFLLTHFQGDSNDTQFISLLTYDANLQVHRLWFFNNRGKAYERRGHWDATARKLALDSQLPSEGITGSGAFQFIGDDRLESTLIDKSVEGKVNFDARWLLRLETRDFATDIPFSARPAAEPEELELLDKMSGNWTIDVQYKNSIWFPDGGKETVTEKVAWVLEGRFLMGRSFNEKNEPMSVWLVTYDPQEKSNHCWFFHSNGSSGQWRVTWDPTSRGFHWRATDMPPGWIGTGFNRWMNDDTFENQALIKDEQGRVLLDMTQHKARKSK